MPRKPNQSTPPLVDPRQTDIEQAIAEAKDNRPSDAIMDEFFTLKTYVEREQERLKEFLKPTTDKMEKARSTLHERLLADGAKNISTDHGTAYLSTITQHKIDPAATPYQNKEGAPAAFGREALLDWMLDNWDEFGNEGMLLNISTEIVQKCVEKTGAPPPGLTISTFKRLNLKKG